MARDRTLNNPVSYQEKNVMMKVIKNKILWLVSLICIVSAGSVYGQDYIPAWKISVGGGYMNYFGDVSPYTIKHWSDWDNVFKFFQYNKYYIPSASFGLSVERYLSPGVSLMLQLNEGTISMSDRYRKPNGDYDKNAPHWDRALNFKTNIKDGGLAFVFRSNNGRMFPVSSFLAPYFFIGGGITHFNVKGDLYDAAGNPYNYADPETQPDGVYETSLRPLMTETSKEYPDVVPYVDAGLGLSLNMGKRVSLSIQTDIKYAFSDYLDDVSGKYKTNYTSPKAAYAAHPGTNAFTPGISDRGNNDGVNDFYIFNKISLSINLGNKANHRFLAPVIYLPQSFRYNDSLTSRDTSRKVLDTSLVRSKKIQDTVTQHLENDLRQIRSELLALRFAHIDQNYIIRQNVVKQNIDALQAERARLRSKTTMTLEDSLRARLDDYQIDSLNNELAAIHQARLQLRREVAYSPIVTEYADSTKIMIYKGRPTHEDSLYLPVIGLSPSGLEDTLQYLPPANIRSGVNAESLQYITPADSIRYELSRLQQEAVAQRDTALYEQLQIIKGRLDSIEHSNISPVNPELDSLTNEYHIRQDSLKILELNRQADSLRRVDSMYIREEQPPKRNAIQRFFDKFKRKKQQPEEMNAPQNADTAKQRNMAPVNPELDSLTNEYNIQKDSLKILELNRHTDSLRRVDSMYIREEQPPKRNAIQRFFDKFKRKKQQPGEMNAPQNIDTANYYNPNQNNQFYNSGYEPSNRAYRNEEFPQDQQIARLLQQNQDEINRLQDEISRLRTETSRRYKEPQTVILRDEYNKRAAREESRQAKLDRRQMAELSAAMVAATAISSHKKQPAASPNIILPPNSGNHDSATLAHIQQQLNALEKQHINRENEQWARNILKDTTANGYENETVVQLQSQVDSLSRQLALLKQPTPVKTEKDSSFNHAVLLNYPTVSMYFATGSSSLSDAEKEKIRPIATVAQKYPQAKLLITGFTDGTGNKRINEILSEKRCAAVKQILIHQYNIPAQRLIIKTNVSEGGANNPLKRRVDLKFVK